MKKAIKKAVSIIAYIITFSFASATIGFYAADGKFFLDNPSLRYKAWKCVKYYRQCQLLVWKIEDEKYIDYHDTTAYGKAYSNQISMNASNARIKLALTVSEFRTLRLSITTNDLAELSETELWWLKQSDDGLHDAEKAIK